jgi:hypothetical protein
MAARHIGKQILGTIIAVLSGWFVAMIFLEAMAVVQLLQQPHYIAPDALWVAPLTVSIVMAYFVVPVWLLLLIPLYLFVPTSSALWRLPICSACGLVAGLVIVGLWFRGLPGVGGVAPEAWSFYVIAAVVGGVTCFMGALTRHVFKPGI